ncbi:MAG TPA: hypothetical protein VGC13_13165 [Longimicrobium sp.]|jgi:hypothetical protein|uniref:hypothetical protein n=1 Tax=Longimicrobium sp. TaxID=2029185 RepID=UPI002EDB8682
MSRERFQTWGTALSAEDFRNALAAAGVLSSLAAPADAEDLLTAKLGTGDEPARWRFPWDELDRRRKPVPLEQVRALAAAWRGALGRAALDREGNSQARLLLHLEGAGTAAGWVVRELSRSGAGAVSVDQGRRGRVRWTWPLQVGCLDDPASRRLMGQLRETRYSDTLSPVQTLHGRGETCDLLVLPYSLREAAAVLMAQVPPVKASCVVVLGGTLEPWERTVELQATLRREAGAAGVLVASVPEGARAPWFEQLVVELSHNRPLDVALSIATRRVDPEPFCFATESLLKEARLGSAALRLAERMSTAPPHVTVEVDDHAAWVLGLESAAGSVNAHVVGARLEDRLPGFAFDSERAEASVIARLKANLKNAMAAAPPPQAVETPAPRFLQAQVNTVADSGESVLQTESFLAGATHHVDVFVGAPRPEWLADTSGEAFPAHLLPPENGHELRVVFSEPRHLDEPQIGTAILPATGDSTMCRFTFVPRAGVPEVEARVAVLYENRVLQTALLRGHVHDGSERRAKGPRPPDISFQVEAVVHPDVSALDERSHFHAALVLNRNNDGERRATATAGDRVGLLELEGLEDTLTFIRAALSETPPTRTGPTGTPFTDETEALLRTLAYHGRLLHDAVVEQRGGDVLRASTRIQIVAAKPDAFLPLELVYDRASPDPETAKMCPNAQQAARTGSCLDCPTLKDGDPSPYVCPAGFWGLSRVIERHAFDDKAPPPATPFELFNFTHPAQTRGTLHPLRCALYAASDRVEGEDAKEKTRIRRVLDALKRAAGAAGQVDSWAAWKEAVRTQRPSLLVVLSHTVYNHKLRTLGLEIAAKERLLSGHIEPAHVCGDGGAEAAGEPPVVLLLGCETIAPEVGYQGFVPALRRAGAAVVLCTSSTVLGREVAPAAEQLVGILKEIMADGAEVTFADAVLRLRRDSVADGMPMALGLVAYGDADWRLAN